MSGVAAGSSGRIRRRRHRLAAARDTGLPSSGPLGEARMRERARAEGASEAALEAVRRNPPQTDQSGEGFLLTTPMAAPAPLK